MRIFDKKNEVWQFKPMSSLDLNQLSTKSNSSGFGGYSQIKIYKGCKIDRQLDTIHEFLVD